MSKVRVAFVGCGGITEKHVEAADASGRVTITALVDPSLEARERISAVIVALGAPAPTQFSSLAEALAADPGKELFSAVDIMVPSFLVNGADLHETVATEALRGGRHVLLEKPVTTTPAAAIRLKKAHLEHAPHCVLAVAENAQFWPEVHHHPALLPPPPRLATTCRFDRSFVCCASTHHQIVAAQESLARGDIGTLLSARAKAWESATGEWAGDYAEGTWRCDESKLPSASFT
jgi:predicted dehydrogenase